MTAAPKRLDEDEFVAGLKVLPLVSIDLVITNPHGQLLVGRRLNQPAQGSYFVPGGRILKEEGIEEAFARIVDAELGGPFFDVGEARLIGLFKHHYDTNAVGAPDTTTDYVVVASHIAAEDLVLDKLPREQHDVWAWVDGDSELPIHSFTRNYFPLLAGLGMNDRQYELLNARRDSANALVWQTPIVGLTGLAFIFLILLGGGTPLIGRWTAAALAVVVSLAAMQLTAKQRYTERQLGIEGHSYERLHGMCELNRKRVSEERLLQESSVTLWVWLFGLTAIGAVVAAVLLTIFP